MIIYIKCYLNNFNINTYNEKASVYYRDGISIQKIIKLWNKHNWPAKHQEFNVCDKCLIMLLGRHFYNPTRHLNTLCNKCLVKFNCIKKSLI